MPDPHAGIREYNRTLSSRAWDTLRNSEYAAPKLIDDRGLRFGRKRLMLWRTAEGFHDYEPETLTVFHPFKEEPPLVRRAIWNRSEDQKPIHKFIDGKAADDLPNPRPTIVVRDTRIDSAEFEVNVGQAANLRIPIVWPWSKDRDSVTTDVGMIGFEFFDIAEPQASLRCGWSMDVPPEWEPVMDWFGRMYDWLETHFDEE